MKNNQKFLLGMLVLALGMTAGCPQEPKDEADKALNGRWVQEQAGIYYFGYLFDNGKYEYITSTAPLYRGKYSTSGDELKWGKNPEYNGAYYAGTDPRYSGIESRWYPYKEWEELMKEKGLWTESTVTVKTKTKYFVSGNMLTLTSESTYSDEREPTVSSATYTKRQ